LRRSPRFYAFDLLWLDGKDLRGLPLIERKKRLARVVRPPALFLQHIERRGIDPFAEVCARDMEAIVAKLASAPYTPGSHHTFVKIKNRAYS
jgi:bifunctional non-homologous end joining protein LigD